MYVRQTAVKFKKIYITVLAKNAVSGGKRRHKLFDLPGLSLSGINGCGQSAERVVQVITPRTESLEF